MTAQKGTFISIEGGEGGGKTTQVKLLKERLPNLFPEQRFDFTHEPGGTPLATKIRELILSDDAKEASGKTMFGLFIAARADHIKNRIVPNLNAGIHVISDRFDAATYAYQVCAMDDPVENRIFRAHYELIPFPRRRIIIDLDPAIARERMKTRPERMTHFDARPPDFHERLRDAYFEWAAMTPTESVLVDGSRSIEEVHKDVTFHIFRFLGE